MRAENLSPPMLNTNLHPLLKGCGLCGYESRYLSISPYEYCHSPVFVNIGIMLCRRFLAYKQWIVNDLSCLIPRSSYFP